MKIPDEVVRQAREAWTGKMDSDFVYIDACWNAAAAVIAAWAAEEVEKIATVPHVDCGRYPAAYDKALISIGSQLHAQKIVADIRAFVTNLGVDKNG